MFNCTESNRAFLWNKEYSGKFRTVQKAGTESIGQSNTREKYTQTIPKASQLKQEMEKEKGEWKRGVPRRISLQIGLCLGVGEANALTALWRC